MDIKGHRMFVRGYRVLGPTAQYMCRHQKKSSRANCRLLTVFKLCSADEEKFEEFTDISITHSLPPCISKMKKCIPHSLLHRIGAIRKNPPDPTIGHLLHYKYYLGSKKGLRNLPKPSSAIYELFFFLLCGTSNANCSYYIQLFNHVVNERF
ncbi:PREDICTED: uncharacterized protein LOC107070335 [Polistes dominula]|uniref:Uncharacterized protein LOC107070335 n=1 Tax=Polistes dominula TaxID=743375 RepID=A0ABM1IUM5_POLDO|nr:PREDICTED: uncharacterized protein LOC107070335 [Polistes dominula]